MSKTPTEANYQEYVDTYFHNPTRDQAKDFYPIVEFIWPASKFLAERCERIGQAFLLADKRGVEFTKEQLSAVMETLKVINDLIYEVTTVALDPVFDLASREKR